MSLSFQEMYEDAVRLLTQKRKQIAVLEARCQELDAGLRKVKDRYLLAFGKGEEATGALVVEMATYAMEALKTSGYETETEVAK